MRGGIGVVIAGVLFGAGCQSDEVFQCQNDDQCVSSGAPGMCQPSGYCSFADAECSSGFRYGDSAPPGLAGQCVEPVDAGSTGVDPTATTTMLPVTTSTTGSTTLTTTTDAESTTQPDGSTSTSTDGSSSDGSGSTSDGSSSSGGASSSSAMACPEFVDEFNNGAVEEDPWEWFQASPPIISEPGEALRFAIAEGHQGFGFIEMAGVDLAEGYAVAHLTSLPQDDAAQFLLRAFPQSGGGSIALALTGGTELSIRNDDAFVDAVNFPGAPDELWMEFYFAGAMVSFAYSFNGEDFVFMQSVPVPGDYSAADISLMGGAFAPTTAPLHFIEVDDFEFCSMPFGA